uniref:Uncharacterized protein n=1 Tax=Fundulus heteroclitus TaxID=8078 RepID=A0A3Q2PNV8_FUNHE
RNPPPQLHTSPPLWDNKGCFYCILFCVCSLSGCLITKKGCSSLASALRYNPSHLKELDLSYNHPGEAGVKLLKAGLKDPQWTLETLRLSGCDISERSCEALSSVIRASCWSLRELDLSNNNLMDSGLNLLQSELETKHLQLEILRLVCFVSVCIIFERFVKIIKETLQTKVDHQVFIGGLPGLGRGWTSGCNLSERTCAALSPVLSSQSSNLRELDLSNNDLMDSGVMLLCEGLKNPQCMLEILCLSGCLITEEGCSSLASALTSNPSHLKELDLSYNHPGEAGVKLLTAGQEEWGLKALRLSGCMIADKGCISLASALSSTTSFLKELDVSYNNPGEKSVKLLNEKLKDPRCSLDTLRYGKHQIYFMAMLESFVNSVGEEKTHWPDLNYWETAIISEFLSAHNRHKHGEH